jgi:cytochrome P450
VAFCPYALHRRPDLYGMDAMLFRPERWDEDMPLRMGPNGVKWCYIPFGAGPRSCLGSKCMLLVAVHLINAGMLVDFALTEAAYTVVRLLLEFPTLKIPEGEAVEPIGAEKQVVTLVLSIGTNCKVSMV